MANEPDPPPPEPMPFDRLGSFCEDLFTVTRGMATRNMELWSSMSQNLRNEKYTADDASTDAAKAMSAGLANFQDAWDLLIRFPERERVAALAPTAFLLFQKTAVGNLEPKWSCDDSVWIRLPSSTVEKYPSHPTIELTGPDASVAEALKGSLGTEIGKSRQAYRLFVQDVGKLAADLTPGVYSGAIYLERPPTLIANLRIVLEGDPARRPSGERATSAGPDPDPPAAEDPLPGLR